MQTISVSSLKAHLSAELKKVERGERITVLDHKRPVAVLGPVAPESLFVREASGAYDCPELEPLIGADPLRFLAEERGGPVIAYLDSSVVLRHILKGEATIRHAFALGAVVSSELLEIECRSVIHRCRMEGELTDDAVVAALERLEAVLAGLSLFALSDKVKRRAMDAFPVSVKTLDALHLSSALFLAEAAQDEPVLVFSHDAAMNRCAKALGFQAPLAD